MRVPDPGQLASHAKTLRSEDLARAEFERSKAEFNERARWWKSPAGLARRAEIAKAEAEAREREFEQLTEDMLVTVARIQEGP